MELDSLARNQALSEQQGFAQQHEPYKMTNSIHRNADVVMVSTPVKSSPPLIYNPIKTKLRPEDNSDHSMNMHNLRRSPSWPGAIVTTMTGHYPQTDYSMDQQQQAFSASVPHRVFSSPHGNGYNNSQEDGAAVTHSTPPFIRAPRQKTWGQGLYSPGILRATTSAFSPLKKRREDNIYHPLATAPRHSLPWQDNAYNPQRTAQIHSLNWQDNIYHPRTKTPTRSNRSDPLVLSGDIDFPPCYPDLATEPQPERLVFGPVETRRSSEPAVPSRSFARRTRMSHPAQSRASLPLTAFIVPNLEASFDAGDDGLLFMENDGYPTVIRASKRRSPSPMNQRSPAYDFLIDNDSLELGGSVTFSENEVDERLVLVESYPENVAYDPLSPLHSVTPKSQKPKEIVCWRTNILFILGVLCLFVGGIILIAYNIVPQEQPSPGPSSETHTVPTVTIAIQLDDKPEETSWNLKCGERLVASVPIRAYEGKQNRLVTTPALVRYGDNCRFTIHDSGGDGIEDGSFEVYRGGSIANLANRLGVGFGNFTYTSEVKFSLDLSTGARPAPSKRGSAVSPGAPVTLSLQLDSFPVETGWRIECNDGFYATGPTGTYTIPFERRAELLYPPIGIGCQFQISDSKGDGMCCDNGPGSYQLYIGYDTANSSNLIAHGGVFESWETVNFVTKTI